MDRELLAFRALKGVSQFWALSPAHFDEMAGNLAASGGRLSPAAAGATSRQFQVGAVAVLPLHGPIFQRPNLLQALLGGTATTEFGRVFDRAIADPSIKAIVLDVDSGGGTVSGITELADKIYAGRRAKHVVAVANSVAASAAYCLAAAAHEIVVSPGALVGSIGIIVTHTEYSEMNARLGIKTTIIRAGKHKAEGNEDEPLSAAARDHMQQIIDDYYDSFAQSIATSRGVSVATVRNRFGEGRVVTAKTAVQLGMASRIATLSEVIDGLSRRFASGGKNYTAQKSLALRRLEIFGTLDERQDSRAKLRLALLGVKGH